MRLLHTASSDGCASGSASSSSWLTGEEPSLPSVARSISVRDSALPSWCQAAGWRFRPRSLLAVDGDSRLIQGTTGSGDPSADGGDACGPSGPAMGGGVGSQSLSSKSECSGQEKLSTWLAQLPPPRGAWLAGLPSPAVASAAVGLPPGAGVLHGLLRLGLLATLCDLLPAEMSLGMPPI
jgi:hypothetical protein